jgi:hypothetical protein
MMSVVAETPGKWWRRAAARLGSLPAGCRMLRNADRVSMALGLSPQPHVTSG